MSFRKVTAVNGTSSLVELTPEDEQKRQEQAVIETAELAAQQARRVDLADRRATIGSELQAIVAASTWAAAKAPLLRVLVFLLRRIGESDT